jgi:hypothetical protein
VNDIVDSKLMQLDPEAAVKLIGVNKTITDAKLNPIHTNSTVYLDLYSKIALPYRDKNKITTTTPIDEALIAHAITPEDHDRLRKAFTDDLDPEGHSFHEMKVPFLKRVQSTLAPTDALGVLLNPERADDFYRYTFDFDKKIEAMKKSGEDPRDLMNPHSKNYFASPGKLSSYQPHNILATAATKNRAAESAAPKSFMDSVHSGLQSLGLESAPAPKKKSLDEIFGKKTK